MSNYERAYTQNFSRVEADFWQNLQEKNRNQKIREYLRIAPIKNNII